MRVIIPKPTCLFFLLILLLPSNTATASGQTKRSAPLASDDLYGGIEVGAKGIKSVVIRVSNGEEGYNIKIVNTEVINTTLVQTKDGKFTPEALKETGQVVQRFYQRMQREFHVSPRHIHIVGGSGLIGDNREDLIEEVKNRTGQDISFLDVDSEVQLAIAGTIPRRYQVGQVWYDNRSTSILIDIGSGNTKGGYQQLKQGATGKVDYDYVTWGIPKGTVTFTNDVNKSAGDTASYQTFVRNAQTLGNSSLRPLIRSEVSQKLGLFNRKKVYLSGGIIWSMVTLLHPGDRGAFVTVTLDDINTFYNRATTNPDTLLIPDLSRISDQAIKREAEREIESVRNTFTPKNLIAGAEVLKAVASELNFSSKSLTFARFGYLSWILSYVRLQAESLPTGADSKEEQQ